MRPAGFEPTTCGLGNRRSASEAPELQEVTTAPQATPADSPAVPPDAHGTELARIIAAWPKLPESVRAGILAMVRAVVGSD